MPALKTLPTGIAAWPQDERPRERFLSKGVQALTDAELVAILIRVGFKGTNAVEMARQLLKQFGSLRAMVEAPVMALLEVKGLKGAKAAQLIAAMEIARRVSVPAECGQLVMKSTAVAADYLRERLRGLAQERFRVLYLNRRNALQEDALIAQGSVDAVRPSLRNIVARALQVNASALIAAVNMIAVTARYTRCCDWSGLASRLGLACPRSTVAGRLNIGARPHFTSAMSPTTRS